MIGRFPAEVENIYKDTLDILLFKYGGQTIRVPDVLQAVSTSGLYLPTNLPLPPLSIRMFHPGPQEFTLDAAGSPISLGRKHFDSAAALLEGSFLKLVCCPSGCRKQVRTGQNR